MSPLGVSRAIVEQTLAALRPAGVAGHEGVALWLSRDTSATGREVVEVYVPAYQASDDYFWIPRESIAALMARLAETGTFVAAQVHTHPEEAFHSRADDRWAIVRHVGALSLVLPRFARETDAGSFWSDAASFTLSPSNKWLAIVGPERDRHIVGVP